MIRFSPYRWVHVALAALAMVATLPGRTHGLGLFTEPIRSTFALDQDSYGTLNMWATLIGGLFCFPCGWLLDCLGTRLVLTGITAALGITVIGMSRITGVGLLELGGSQAVPLDLFAVVLLTRGFGQSALSVASLSLMARSVGPRDGLAKGTYALLVSAGFVAAFGVLRSVILASPDDWRTPWAGIGVAVLATAGVFLLTVRGRVLSEKSPDAVDPGPTGGSTLGEALWTRTFWVFALAVSYYGMVVAGTSIFGEDLLKERGLDKKGFLNATILGIPFGLAANMIGGFLAPRVSVGRLLAVALVVLTSALAAFPWLNSELLVYAYAIVLAVAGGVISVVFYTVWRPAFGLTHLGRIQGAAQFVTVIFSALGPKLLGSAKIHLGSYSVVFPYLAAVAGLMAVAAWFTRVPVKEAP
jgi:MFS family permease